MAMMACNCPVISTGPSISSCGGTFVLFMALLEEFLRMQCDIADPCGQFQRLVPSKDYDFIVVGGGSAGAVVANRLSEVPNWKVLLVEAGDNEPLGSQVPSVSFNMFGSSIDWHYQTEPEEKACLGKEGSRCYWPRGKVIGGTSVLNGMMYLRGSRKDFDDWERLGNTGWSYENVLPYFMKSEDNLQIKKVDSNYHGVGGYLPVTQFNYHPPLSDAILKAAKELGHRIGDLNGEIHAGFAIAQATNKNGIRYSTARAFLRPVKHRRNLHILLNTTVARVLIDSTKKQAYGVEVIRENGKKEIIRAHKEVIVSGGAVNSPQILLLSGIGPKDDLAKVGIPVVHDLPGVGRNLHNHVAFGVQFFVNDKPTSDLDWAKAMQYMLTRDGLMSGTGLSQTTGLIKSKFANASEDHPDIQLFFRGYLAGCSKTGEVGEINAKAGASTNKKVTILPTALHTRSKGYLTLKDKNPLSHPRIFANYLTEQIDVDTLIEGVLFALKLAETKALQEYGFKLDTTPAKGCENKEFGSNEYWECAIRTDTAAENHQAGSCKMGPDSDPDAVVDPHLQVHGVKNLRVIDASIMPQVTSGNTNAPIIMIAEKGSDKIKMKWLNQY